MQYLRIVNPGLADMNALMVLGVSTSRYNRGSIGQFGTGSKFSIALLLREGVAPEIYIGKQKMSFFTKPLALDDGSEHQQVHVKLSGVMNRTEKLSYTTGLGELDWDDVAMAVREFVSNAIDGCAKQGLDSKAVEIDIVDNPRAIRGGNHTAVFIPLTPEINRVYMSLSDRFLHFRKGVDISQKILPKLDNSGKTRFYKQGVLVLEQDIPSTFDYNLGEELELDESRNASWWDVRSACADAVRSITDKDKLVDLIKDIADGTDKEWFEKELDGHYLSSKYSSDEVREKRGSAWQEALEEVFGKNVVACTVPQFNDTIRAKGYVAVNLPSNFAQLLGTTIGIRRDIDVLNGLERKGRVEKPVTASMQECLDFWWELIELCDMTNGKEKPSLKAFQENMEGESQVNGEYCDDVVWVRWDLDGSQHIRKTILEELAHHCSGATDMSRDFQEWILRFMAYYVYNK